MVAKSKGLWGLVWGQPYVDARELAGAVQAEAAVGPHDFRTRLLIRDSVAALREYWGRERVGAWLEKCSARPLIEEICDEDLGEPGFPTLRERLMENIDPEAVRQVFRELGGRLRQRTRIAVGGSIALIMPGYLSRATEDIDIVNEVPAEIRAQHALLQDLRKRYGLLVTHFQSHYLPSGWDNRVHYFDTFDELRVDLVDVYDVLLSKLFSSRTKDLDDMRLLTPQIDKDTLVRRFRETTASMLASESLRQCAQKNWYIVYGEQLPT
jgi:hypothetical protein